MNVPIWSQIIAGLVGVAATGLAIYVPMRWRRTERPAQFLVTDPSATPPTGDVDARPDR